MPSRDYVTFKCPYCGANIRFDFDEEENRCDYCDQPIDSSAVLTDPSNSELYKIWSEEHLKRRKIQHEYDLASKKMDLDFQEHQNYVKEARRESRNRGVKGCLIFLALLCLSPLAFTLGPLVGVAFLIGLAIFVFKK